MVRGPKMVIRCLAPPWAVLILKKSAFHLMTDPVFPTVSRLIHRKLFNNYGMLDDIRPKYNKLDTGIHALGAVLHVDGRVWGPAMTL